ncbi:MAG TPA: hypothetical protein VNT75_09890 [Symbiobacteriaceae bacterium]|nr:hypothetical protein [Symbiobacteriaceae bacterium]
MKRFLAAALLLPVLIGCSAPPPPSPARSWKERFALWRYQDGRLDRVLDGDA